MSVDLERLINESKERLGKHKDYLERTAQRGTGTSGSDQHQPVTMSPPRTYSPARFAATSPPQHQHQQHSSRNIGGGGGGSRPASSGAAAASHQPRHLSPNQFQQQQPQRGGGGADSPSYSGYNPYASNIARAGHENYGAPHNFHETSPGSANKQKRAGFYLSGRPLTKVYDRGQKFMGSKSSFLEKQRQESWEKEMSECTFSPFVSKRAAKAQGRAMAAAGGKSPKSPSPTQHYSAASNGKKDPMADKSLLDWCVESDQSNVGFHVDAPSVFLHIQRQQDARKAKEDGEAKLSIDTTHWQPKLTVPQEFNFGRSDQPIRALRKPMLQMVRLSSGEDGSRPGSVSPGRQRGGGGVTPRGGGRTSKSPPKRSASEMGTEEEEIAARQAEQHKKYVEVSNVASEQKQQIQQQSEEIAKLNGLIQSLKMESEAAKAKVREMALSQTIAGQK